MTKKIKFLVLSSALSQLLNADFVPEILSKNNEFIYSMVTEENSPYTTKNRKDYSLALQGCAASLIGKHWAITASHCLTYKKAQHPWNIKVGYISKKNKYIYNHANKVIRHKYLDLALIRLSKPINAVEPIILLKDSLKKYDGIFWIKEVYRQTVWSHIPTRVEKHGHLYVSKPNRRGGPGTSGSPWVIHSSAGDVLIGVTHGSGYAAQVAKASEWILSTVSKYTEGNELKFITKKNMKRKNLKR